MKGLLKNNYFAVRSNAKAFSVFMLLLGIFVVAVISPSLLMGYALQGKSIPCIRPERYSCLSET